MGGLLLSASGALLLERLLPAPFDLVFLRMGVIACVLAVASLLTPDRRRVPRAVRGLNHSALTCYVLHMVLLWGAPGLTGLVHWVGPTCGWWECLGLTLACLSLATFGGSVASLISARTSAAFGFATQPQSSTQDAS